MAEPLRLGLIGCGAHIRSQHVPPLLAASDAVRVVACADPQLAAAEAMAADFGAAALDSSDALLARDDLDAVLVGTPPAVTDRLALQVAERGLVVWIEKPIAPDRDRALALVEALGDRPAMVSLNRRFDPAFAALLAWDRPAGPLCIDAEMARENRREPDFVTATAIHLIDVVLALSGPVTIEAVDAAEGGRRIRASGDGVELELRILPTVGRNAERIRLTVGDVTAEGRSGFFDEATWDIAGERGAVDPAAPHWVRSGTQAETAAFLAACAGQRSFSPVPRDFLPAADFAAEVHARR